MKTNKIICLLASSLLLIGCNNKNTKFEIKNDPSKITTYSADGKISIVEEYTYDENGRLIQLLESNYFENEIEKGRTTIHYAGDLIITEEVDFYDNKTGKWDLSNYFTSFAYAPNGNMIESSTFDKKDGAFNYQSKFIYVYDENNNKISETYLSYDNDNLNFIPRVYVEYVYDGENRLVKEIMYSNWNDEPTLTLSFYETYIYNDGGDLIRSNEYDENDKLGGYTTYAYESNKTTKIFTLIEDETEEFRTQNVTYYDAYNRIEKEEYSTYDSSLSQFVLGTYSIYEY